MRREFIMLQSEVSLSDRNVQAFLDQMRISTGRGFQLESSGTLPSGRLFALMSKPAGLQARGFGALKPEDRDLVQAMAENNMNAVKIAREMQLTSKAILYRCDRIQATTGLDPRNFYDLNELLYMEEDNDEHGIE